MSWGAVLVEALKAIPDVVRALRGKPAKPLPAAVTVDHVPSSAELIEKSGKRRPAK